MSKHCKNIFWLKFYGVKYLATSFYFILIITSWAPTPCQVLCCKTGYVPWSETETVISQVISAVIEGCTKGCGHRGGIYSVWVREREAHAESFFFLINFDLSTVCFTMLCYFLLYSKMNLPYIHILSPPFWISFPFRSPQYITREFLVLYNEYVLISYPFYVSYQEITLWKRPWCCEILKAKGEEGSRWLDEFEQTPGNSEGQGSVACCSPWGRKESDTT